MRTRDSLQDADVNRIEDPFELGELVRRLTAIDEHVTTPTDDGDQSSMGELAKAGNGVRA